MRSQEGDEQAGQPGDEPGIGPPPNLDLPLFAYGLLKPGQLAHRAVIAGDSHCQTSELRDAGIRVRDGIPVLDSDVPGGRVDGTLIRFTAGADGYSRVGQFEPRHQYRWDVRQVHTADGGLTEANLLVGKRPRKGSSVEIVQSWDFRLDPILSFGFQVASELVTEIAEPPFPVLPGDDPALWDRFFRLSSAYLLLWTVIERYTALRFGPGLDPHRRVRLLDEAPEFRAAVVAVDVDVARRVVDSRDPERSYSIKPDGSAAAPFWYAVRSNLSHRGKSAYKDGQLLRQCSLDLRAVMAVVLAEQEINSA